MKLLVHNTNPMIFMWLTLVQKEKRDTHRKRSEDLEQIESEKKVIKVTEFITVGEVATMMDVSGNDIISAGM